MVELGRCVKWCEDVRAGGIRFSVVDNRVVIRGSDAWGRRRRAIRRRPKMQVNYGSGIKGAVASLRDGKDALQLIEVGAGIGTVARRAQIDALR